MDPLSQLLGGIRAEGSVVTHAVLAAPWAIRFADRAPMTMVTVLRGGGTLVLADGSRTPLVTNDTAIIRGPEPFHFADQPGSVGVPHTEYEIACFTEPDCDAADLSGIAWNSESEQATALVVGAYRTSARRHERLVSALPPVLVVGDDTDMCPWMEAAAAEAVGQSAGSQAMMDRLLDWGLVCTLRSWFEQAGSEAPAWYRGVNDPLVAPALQAIHTRPGVPWTVASLASQAGVSRALFAKRFAAIMGTPPLAYLTEFRMDEAEELLATTDLTVAQIAKALGYADAFGFSAAFKRRKGMSPTGFRAAA
ncbi:AraC family transcriptional regulator [Nocardia sp. NBC_01503]|uniref:AraC family transcriptional regulator n=1 Tax=Nocardia sp. NBC_01503 TaxID=2975997 RepID=UPI002E7B1AE7|nr:AraC family transcriptional regulator [Nocardia sp. NBC_01503]WTL33234.1 AraC family transcriptional regulator [Nocardia sp. NBC_01503]